MLPEAASESATQVDRIYLGLLLISLAVLGFLFALLLYAVLGLDGKKRSLGKLISRSHWQLEVGWSIIPLLIFLGLFAWGAKLYLQSYHTSEKAETINVVGRQWMWQIYYPDGRMEHNELHLPAGQTTTLTLSSEDVIHSFFVPAFRLKRDVVPGKYVQFSVTPSKAGRYRLFCAEYCGTEHSSMIGWVNVMKPGAYAAWREGKPSRDSFAERGKDLFHQHGCSGCHAPEANIHAPSLEGIAGRQVPLASGRFVRADLAYLRDSILLPGKQVVAGYENLMPSYQGIISEADLAALVSYLQSLESGGTFDE